MAPFTDALVVTLDGVGEGLSGSISIGRDRTLTTLTTIPQKHSLGVLYFDTIRYLGYGPFDEYKVIGLAPYGRSSCYRDRFESVCALGPNGAFTVDLGKLHVVLRELIPTPRQPDEPLEDVHRDVAASLQEALENAVFHMLRHYQGTTGLRRLCLAGGVARNSTLVG